jgi:mono/diheme cytochrome c family protein
MRRHVRFWVVALGWAILAPGATRGIACGAPSEDPNKTQAISGDRDGFRQAILPVFARYCASCHGPDRPKGGLNLETLRDEGTFQSRRRTWVRIRENLEGEIMPPEDSAQPSRAEVDRALGAIKSLLARDDCGKPPNPGRVTIRRLNRAEYNNTIRDLFGIDDRPADDFPADDVGYGFDNMGDVLSLPPLLMERYLAAAERVTGRAILANPATAGSLKPESHRRILFREPISPGEYPDAARAILERFTTRAYRRPVTPPELARLIGLVEQALADGESFERGIEIAVQAVLVSPHFLFRVELDSRPRGLPPAGPSPGRSEPIGDFEVASRLSYFLWSSMPDEQLFRLAGEGKLRSPDVLAAQVRRMLLDPRARALVDNFGGQWLQIRSLKGSTPDRERFPQFDEPLREAMFRETELFLAEVIREDRSILDLLDADFTYVNERLARHYGIKGVVGPEFRRVRLDRPERGGLLTHASVLTVTSNPNRTSPVKRGRWVLEQILGAPPPPPPPEVTALKEERAVETAVSVRRRMEQHRAQTSCAVCHNRLDPLGFGLENYDGVGTWRDQEAGAPVDASGTLPSGESFRGPGELKAILKARPREFARCLTEKMLTYALGRGLEESDRCAVDRIVKDLESREYRFSVLVQGIASSDPFLKRPY